jgi:hypothetical protein
MKSKKARMLIAVCTAMVALLLYSSIIEPLIAVLGFIWVCIA